MRTAFPCYRTKRRTIHFSVVSILEEECWQRRNTEIHIPGHVTRADDLQSCLSQYTNLSVRVRMIDPFRYNCILVSGGVAKQTVSMEVHVQLQSAWHRRYIS